MTHSIVSLALLITLASGSTSLAHPHEAQSPADFATQLSAAFQNAAENIKPSVVRIGTAEVVPHTTGYHWRTGVPFIEGTGSGLIISADGYIATNDHVVADADIILVTLHDGRQFEAEAVGRDRQSDLAVIRIEASDLTPATFADPATTHVGQWVLAVGSPFGLSHSYSAGIISATGRSNLGLSRFEHMVQTDAAINPGNSGGPLVDLHGHVVGVNTAIKTLVGTGVGVGFAIPVDMVQQVCGSLIEHGDARRGFLGVSLQDLNPAIRETLGPNASLCQISRVYPNLPAHAAGLEAGDVIQAINDHPIRSTAELMHAVAVLPPGDTCCITFKRGDTVNTAAATLTRRAERQRP